MIFIIDNNNRFKRGYIKWQLMNVVNVGWA